MALRSHLYKRSKGGPPATLPGSSCPSFEPREGWGSLVREDPYEGLELGEAGAQAILGWLSSKGQLSSVRAHGQIWDDILLSDRTAERFSYKQMQEELVPDPSSCFRSRRQLC